MPRRQAEYFLPIGAAAALPQHVGAVAVRGGVVAQALVAGLLQNQRALRVEREGQVIDDQERGALAAAQAQAADAFAGAHVLRQRLGQLARAGAVAAGVVHGGRPQQHQQDPRHGQSAG
ncbi:hypothetical protein G6F40_015387 [Rhizopus arrhizus]|nr:hypothetical protein G6F40_015387 [Rhizopus arrhizus]